MRASVCHSNHLLGLAFGKRPLGISQRNVRPPRDPLLNQPLSYGTSSHEILVVPFGDCICPQPAYGRERPEDGMAQELANARAEVEVVC